MKKSMIISSLSLLGLAAWMYFWTPELIVCRTTAAQSLDIVWMGRGWQGLGRECLAPILFLLLIGGSISYYAGARLMEKRKERQWPFAMNLSLKMAMLKRKEENLMELLTKRDDFEREKTQFTIQKEMLEWEIEAFKEKAEDATKELVKERQDHINRKDKLMNLEKKLEEMKAERITSERGLLALERDNYELTAYSEPS